MFKGSTIKISALALIAVVIIAAFIFGSRFLSFEQVKAMSHDFIYYYQQHTLAFTIGYFLFYLVFVAIGAPGATPFTILAGAVFGLYKGTVLVSFASSIGATIAFIIGRSLLRDWVEAKFGKKLSKLNRGVKREGAFYLFTIRMIPIFPFFVINTAMALTRLRTWTFYWVSQAGMLPGTIIYVNAGTQLAKIETTSDLLSWNIILSFVLLGLFPLISKKLLDLYRKKLRVPALDEEKNIDNNTGT